MAKRNNTRKQSTRTTAAFRAHLTRAQNKLAETSDRAERRALRARIAELSQAVGA